MTLIALVLVLGGLGAIGRAVATHTLPPLLGTLAINLLAAFVLGAVASWNGVLADGVRLGLLGAASTWSTLANELASMLRSRQILRASAYLIGTLVLGVLAAWLGLQLG